MQIPKRSVYERSNASVPTTVCLYSQSYLQELLHLLGLDQFQEHIWTN